MKQESFRPSYPIKSLIGILSQGETATVNDDRMALWRIRWRSVTGNEPVSIWATGFCRTCNKPAWFVGVARIAGVHCPGH